MFPCQSIGKRRAIRFGTNWVVLIAVSKNKCEALPNLAEPPWSHVKLQIGDVDYTSKTNTTLRVGELNRGED